MVSEKQTFSPQENDPFPFTTLREDMETDGFPEELISMLINTHQDNPTAARAAYDLMRETKVRQGELPARPEHDTEHEVPVPMTVQEKMGARAIGESGAWRMSGTLDDEEEPASAVAPQAPASTSTYSAPPQASAEGMDLSPEGIRNWVRTHHGN